MARKYLSLDRLTEYDALLKAKMAEDDTAILEQAKKDASSQDAVVLSEAQKSIDAVQTAVDTLSENLQDAIDGKANASHTHDDRYYTETEIDTKISNVNSTISTHTGNTTVHITSGERTNWNSAYSHSTSAHAPSNAEKNIIIGIQKNGTDLTVDSSTRKVNITVPTTAADIGAAASGHNHDSAYDKKGAAAEALTSAQAYADSAATTVKNDLLNGAGAAYDTLKELGDLIVDNADAIEALETIASGKADAEHTHAIADVSGLQSALDGKAASSHGTHVTYSTTAPVMDGTASVGSAATVARSDHRHPTDTSRASKTEFDTHVADTTKHITSTERTNWGAAYTHSQAAHAPSNAEKNQNAFSNVKVGTTTIAADTVTDTLEIAEGIGISVTADATNDKVTITNTGVIGVGVGSTNGTISVVTNGGSTNVAVKGLGSAAYTDSSAYATASHVHAVDTALSSTSTNPVQNKVVNSAISTLTSTVSSNTSSISAHSTAISNLQTAVGEIQEITSAEIQQLFQ